MNTISPFIRPGAIARAFTTIPALFAACLLLLAVTVAHAALPIANVEYDQWYIVEMDGQRAGWARMTARIKGDNIESFQDTYMVVRRGAIELPIQVTMRFVETRDCQPVAIELRQMMAAQEMKQTYQFQKDRVLLVSNVGGAATTSVLPLPDGKWMTPTEAQHHIMAKLEAGETTITTRVLDGSMGLRIVETTMKHVGEENIEVFGRTAPAIVWDVTTDLMPGIVSRAYVDNKGVPLKTTFDMGGFKMTMLAADEQLAKAKIDAPEMMANTFVKPQGNIDNPRRLRRAVYDLQLKDADNNAIDLPSVGVQRVERQPNGVVRVTIDLDKPVPNADDQPDDSHLAASAMLNHEDPKIRELLAEALKGLDADATPMDKARRLSQFVSRYVESKNLSVGFASASETARTATGDCTEHGVLLAALLRAADIPSRTVSGLIYVDRFLGNAEIFGYHMWTQAWLTDEQGNARWIDLDATLDDGGYDAAHITISTSAQADGQPTNDMVALVPLLGRLQITVVE